LQPVLRSKYRGAKLGVKIPSLSMTHDETRIMNPHSLLLIAPAE